MTRRTIQGVVFGLTAACSWAVGAPALAGGDKHHKGERAAAEIKMMDANGDGKLSAEEHAAGAQKMFATMDANKDAKVTATEMEAAHDQMMGRKAGEPGKADHDKGDKHHGMKMSAADKIKVVDTDNDGVLTAQEHSAGAAKMFERMDTDKDGMLTQDELAAGHKKFMSKGTK